MHRHPYSALWLHDDNELESLAGSEIVERVTLHEWPLSCVQRLTLADGRKRIYKAQYGPTVEPKVYARVRSDLLPWAETIYRADGHFCIRLIDWQRPILGPADLDLVDLLNSLEYDPLRHVDAGVVQVWVLLSIGWLTEAKARWFPEGESYDRQIANLERRLVDQIGRVSRPKPVRSQEKP